MNQSVVCKGHVRVLLNVAHVFLRFLQTVTIESLVKGPQMRRMGREDLPSHLA